MRWRDAGQVGIPGGYRGGYWEGAIPGTHPPGTLDWYCQGPTHARTPYYRVPRALRGPPGPSAHPGSRTRRYARLEPIKARFRYIYLKVSQYPECHQNMLMRPAIVPVPKTGRKVTTLNSEISIICSLLSQGINGPVLGLRHVLSSKRQSVTKCAHPYMRGWPVTSCRTDQYPRATTLWSRSSLILQLDLVRTSVGL